MERRTQIGLGVAALAAAGAGFFGVVKAVSNPDASSTPTAVSAATRTGTPEARVTPAGTPRPIVVGGECKVQVLGLGFQYAKDPENLGNPSVIDPYSFQIKGMPDFGRMILTVRENPADVSSKVLDTIPMNMNPHGDYFQVRSTITTKANDLDGKGVTLEASAEDDLVVDPRTNKKPMKKATIPCGQTGIIYFGRSAQPDSIDALAVSTTSKGVNRIGNRIQEIVFGELNYNVKTAIEGDNTVDNLKYIKENKDKVKKYLADIKAAEKKNAEPTPVGKPIS